MSENAISLYNAFLDNGDEQALEALVRAYSDPLVRYAHAYVRDGAAAEEAMEDAFAALILSRKRFREEGQLRTYLYKATRSKCIDRLRRQKFVFSLSDSALSEDLFSDEDTEEGETARERRRIVRECIARLPEQYREILYLFYFEGLDFDGICRVTGKSRKQAYNLLSRARDALKELLLKEGFEG